MSLKRQCLSAVVCTLITIAAVQAADDGKAAKPFNGKDLSGWKLKRAEGSNWVVGVAEMDPENPRELLVKEAEDDGAQLINRKGKGVDIYTEREFGDCVLSLELMVPQGSNSGIYLMGNYEVQVLDSWGREKAGPGDIGGLYGAAAPRLNAARKPGQWQEFVIEFQTPRFESGKKVSNALFKKVTLNGLVIHENVELKGVTGGSLGRGEQSKGPLMFQGDHGPVAYRNIKICECE